jgi:hypothetical protein
MLWLWKSWRFGSLYYGHRGLGYGEALRHLAKKYSIAIQESPLTDEQLQAQNARESLYIALNYAKNYYQNNLFQHEEGQSIGYPYFKERGFLIKLSKLSSWDIVSISGMLLPKMHSKMAIVSMYSKRQG